MTKGWKPAGGGFSISINMSARAVAGDNIEASAFSLLHDTVRDGVNECINKDGKNTVGADLLMGGNRLTNTTAPTTITDAMDANSYINQYPVYMVDDGASSITISCASPITYPTFGAGTQVAIKMGRARPSVATSTTATVSTQLFIKIGSQLQSLEPLSEQDFLGNTFQSAGVYTFVHDGSKFRPANLHTRPKNTNVAYATSAGMATNVSVGLGTGTTMNLLMVSVSAGDLNPKTDTGGGLKWNSTSNTLTATGDMVVSSDDRLKEAIKDIPNPLQLLSSLRGVEYDKADTGHQLGVLAQNIQLKIPSAVKEGEDGFLTVSYNQLVGLLIAAVNELSEKVNGSS